VWLLTAEEFILARLMNQTSSLLQQNLRYNTYDLGPPFTQEQCQAAWLRDWLYVLACSNLNIANRFRRALSTTGMFSRNFLNVLLHNMQDGNIMYDLRVVQIVVSDISDSQ